MSAVLLATTLVVTACGGSPEPAAGKVEINYLTSFSTFGRVDKIITTLVAAGVVPDGGVRPADLAHFGPAPR